VSYDTQRPGIGVVGIFEKRQPTTEAQYCFKKLKLTTKAKLLRRAKTEADSELQPKLTTSCPNNAKPHVSGSLFFPSVFRSQFKHH
jgi:hypothetical protein